VLQRDAASVPTTFARTRKNEKFRKISTNRERRKFRNDEVEWFSIARTRSDNFMIAPERLSQEEEVTAEPEGAESSANGSHRGETGGAGNPSGAPLLLGARIAKTRPADEQSPAMFLGRQEVAAGACRSRGGCLATGCSGHVPGSSSARAPSEVVLMIGFATRCGSCRSSSSVGMSIWIFWISIFAFVREAPEKRFGHARSARPSEPDQHEGRPRPIDLTGGDGRGLAGREW